MDEKMVVSSKGLFLTLLVLLTFIGAFWSAVSGVQYLLYILAMIPFGIAFSELYHVMTAGKRSMNINNILLVVLGGLVGIYYLPMGAFVRDWLLYALGIFWVLWAWGAMMAKFRK